jgi:hypothetical protein
MRKIVTRIIMIIIGISRTVGKENKTVNRVSKMSGTSDKVRKSKI